MEYKYPNRSSQQLGKFIYYNLRCKWTHFYPHVYYIFLVAISRFFSYRNTTSKLLIKHIAGYLVLNSNCRPLITHTYWRSKSYQMLPKRLFILLLYMSPYSSEHILTHLKKIRVWTLLE